MTQITSQSQSPVPRGWAGLIQQVNQAKDLQTFHQSMLDLQCKIVSAEYGALWVKGEADQLQMAAFWPAPLSENQEVSPVTQLLYKSAESGFSRQTSQVLKVTPQDTQETGGLAAYVFVTAIHVGDQIVAVSTAVADCPDSSMLQRTVPMRELAGGLYEIFAAREQTRQARHVAHQTRTAMALLAAAQEAEGFGGASLNLVNELARQLQCTRVTLGWVRNGKICVKAMSDTDDLKRHSEYVAMLELAMGECLDQEHPVLFPLPSAPEPLLEQSVTYAHRKLVQVQGGTYIVSIPLRLRDQWLGVLTLERQTPIDVALVTQLQLLADVVSPQLADRHELDRSLVGHAWNSVKWGVSYLTGPRHVAWKMLAILLVIGLGIFAFGSVPYHISAEFTLESQTKRIIPAPYEGDLANVAVRPGDRVKAGQILASLNATELKLQLAEAISQLRVYTLQKQQAMAEKKIAQAQQAQASVRQTQAKIDLLRYQIDKSNLRSPMDGVVLAGDWYDKVGGVIDQGKTMFEIAPLTDLIPVLRVRENDVSELQKYFQKTENPPHGVLTTRSRPSETFRFLIRRILPQASPVAGKNVFQVRCRFELETYRPERNYQVSDMVMYQGVAYRARAANGPGTKVVAPGMANAGEVWSRADWLRPGMEGVGRVDVGWRPIWWVATHRITDMMHLWTWW